MRQESGLIVVSAVVVGLVVALLGTVRMRPTVFSSSEPGAALFKENVRGTVDFFDPNVTHTIEVSVSEVEYEKMVADYQKSGDKTWIEADAVIDGTVVGSVGVRLKGNSTLMSLRRSASGGMPGGGMPEGAPPGFPGAPNGSASPEAPAAPGAEAREANKGGRPSMSNVSFEEPSSLPIVLSFDKYIDGRGYQGIGELAVRPVVGQGGATLNEALALQLIADSGQASQRYTWVQFRFKGGTSTTRLVVENPDAAYSDGLGLGDGALYKSRSKNEFTYKGEEPTAYADDFAQLSSVGTRDLAPVIRLLQFVHTSSDETFDAELSSYVDVESFALYCATHELLNNFDDMSGPGRNFLLWYGAKDGRFTVITWDMNLAITGMGGGMGGGGMRGPGGPSSSEGGGGEERRPRGAPGEASGGAPRTGGGGPGAGGAGGPGGGGMRMGNRLKERFLASAAFADVREAAREKLRAAWFDGHGASVAKELAARVPLTDTLTAEKVDGELTTLLAALERLGTSAAKPAAVIPAIP